MRYHFGTVYPAIFYKYFIPDVSSGYNTYNIHTRNIGFKGFPIMDRPPVRIGHLNPDFGQEADIGFVAGHAEYKIVGYDQISILVRHLQHHIPLSYLFYGG